jgi:hypothetical protein
MTKTAGRDVAPGGDEARETPLEQRFREVGARALIDELSGLSASVGAISKRLAEVERSAETILTLLDFPFPRQGAAQTPLMKRVVVTARMFCNPADGFHRLEFSPDGTAFRWTGPQAEFRFTVYADRRQGCRAELALIDNERLRDVAELACYIDRSWTPCELRRADADGLARVTFSLPPLEINRGTEILFSAPFMFVPRDLNPDSLDTRSLGVQFVELRIDRADVGVAQAGADDVKHSAN